VVEGSSLPAIRGHDLATGRDRRNDNAFSEGRAIIFALCSVVHLKAGFTKMTCMRLETKRFSLI
jgi:hypothetical protein